MSRVPVRHLIVRALRGPLSITLLMPLFIIILWVALRQVLWSVEGSPTYTLASLDGPPQDQLDLHLELIALDEVQRQLHVRVSGFHTCSGACPDEELLLVALREGETQTRGVAPSVTIALPGRTDSVLQDVQIPARGALLEYPFDRADIHLGVALRRKGPDGTVAAVPVDQVSLQVTVQSRLTDLRMRPPQPLDPRTYDAPRAGRLYLVVSEISVERMPGLKLMTVVLLALIAAAAIYTVYMRSLRELVIGSGTLMLSIWSIRNILVPGAINQRTGIDVALVVLISILWATLCVRLIQTWVRGQQDLDAATEVLDENSSSPAGGVHFDLLGVPTNPLGPFAGGPPEQSRAPAVGPAPPPSRPPSAAAADPPPSRRKVP